MPHRSFDRTRGVACGRQRRALFRIAAIIGAVGFAPGMLSAQSYFTPLVTPPASVGTCQPVRQQRRGRDSTLVAEHRLVIMSRPPGSSRDLFVMTQKNGALGYSDMTRSTMTTTSSSGGDVVAFTDSVGHMRGWRDRSATALPDSVARLDTANARHRHAQLAGLRAQIAAHTKSSHAPLTAAEQLRVREMAAWLLRRCPG